jgi:hypothetical protein
MSVRFERAHEGRRRGCADDRGSFSGWTMLAALVVAGVALGLLLTLVVPAH